jgi:hypothetical protein
MTLLPSQNRITKRLGASRWASGGGEQDSPTRPPPVGTGRRSDPAMRASHGLRQQRHQRPAVRRPDEPGFHRRLPHLAGLDTAGVAVALADRVIRHTPCANQRITGRPAWLRSGRRWRPPRGRSGCTTRLDVDGHTVGHSHRMLAGPMPERKRDTGRSRDVKPMHCQLERASGHVTR